MPVARVSMPGAHDAATFRLWPLPVSWEYLKECARTQEWNIWTQLSAGIRFLDLRVKSDGWLYHGPMACSLTLEAALQTCTTFLQQHGGEFLIARIKDEERSGSSGQRVHELVLACARRAPLRLARELPCVEAVRGRILVLQDWDGPEVALRWAGVAMRVQDQCKQSSAKEKWADVRRHMVLSKREAGRRLCVNFLSAHFLPRLTARHFAAALNPRLSSCLAHNHRGSVLGIMAMDFPTQELCSQIVNTNFVQAEHSYLLASLDSSAGAYDRLLQELDSELGGLVSKAELGRAACSVERLAALYSRLILQRAEFAVKAESLRERCAQAASLTPADEGAQMPYELREEAAEATQQWARQVHHARKQLRSGGLDQATAKTVSQGLIVGALAAAWHRLPQVKPLARLTHRSLGLCGAGADASTAHVGAEGGARASAHGCTTRVGTLAVGRGRAAAGADAACVPCAALQGRRHRRRSRTCSAPGRRSAWWRLARHVRRWLPSLRGSRPLLPLKGGRRTSPRRGHGRSAAAGRPGGCWAGCLASPVERSLVG